MGLVMDSSPAIRFEHVDAARFPPAPGPQRHIACNPCRESKVKCDGFRPVCKRCRGTGSASRCSFVRKSAKSGRPKKPRSEPPLSTTTSSDSSTSYTPQGDSRDTLGWLEATRDGDSVIAHSFGTAAPSWPATSQPTPPDDGVLGDDESPPGEFSDIADMVVGDFQTALQVDIAPPDGLTTGLTKTLVSVFCGWNQQTFMCFEDPESLESYFEQPGYEAVAVKYAICCHASALASRVRLPMLEATPGIDYSLLATVSNGAHAALFYRLARAALNQSDLGKKSATSLLLTLLATILLGLYELQQAEVGCAWLSESRAVWIMEELQLHRLDSDQALPLSDEGEAPAARRAFWAARGLASFLMTVHQHHRIMPCPMEEVSTCLPTSNGAPGLMMSDVCHGTVTRLLSVDEGLTALRALSTRVLAHASRIGNRKNSATDGTARAYNFWTHQSQLEESLGYLQTFTDIWTAGSMGGPDFDAVLVDLQTRALVVVLGEAKLAKMSSCQGMRLDPGQLHPCRDAARQHALDSAAALEALNKALPGDAATDLSVTWVAYVTLQSLLRCQRRTQASWTEGNTVIGRAPAAFLPPWAPTVATLSDAMLFDSFESLQAKLADWGSKIPIASLYSDQIQLELDFSTDALQARVVGLLDP